MTLKKDNDKESRLLNFVDLFILFYLALLKNLNSEDESSGEGSDKTNDGVDDVTARESSETKHIYIDVHIWGS